MDMGSPDVAKRRRPHSVAVFGGVNMDRDQENVSQRNMPARRQKRGREEQTAVEAVCEAASSSSAARGEFAADEVASLRGQLGAKDEVIRQLLAYKVESDAQLRAAHQREATKLDENKILKRGVDILEGRLARAEGEKLEYNNMMQHASVHMARLQQENALMRQHIEGPRSGGPSHYINPQPPPDVF